MSFALRELDILESKSQRFFHFFRGGVRRNVRKNRRSSLRRGRSSSCRGTNAGGRCDAYNAEVCAGVAALRRQHEYTVFHAGKHDKGCFAGVSVRSLACRVMPAIAESSQLIARAQRRNELRCHGIVEIPNLFLLGHEVFCGAELRFSIAEPNRAARLGDSTTDSRLRA